MNTAVNYLSLDDRHLVELYHGGDRQAFRQIVERYQAMICGLAVSACGDVARSEDLAQEVFIAAWKQLPELREPEKLRGWLTGIARNLINNSSRQLRRTPTARAEALSPETPVGEDGPREQTITAEESALMWRALESIPETYREPMVLYYREHRSVTVVAAALEVSEENVRQRLTRGRAMLSERMAKLVEETLERSAPSKAFAGAVLLALPAGMGSIAAETLGAASSSAATKAAATSGGVVATVAKGGMAVKLLAVAGLLPAMFNGAVDFLRFRANFEAAESASARRRIAITHLAPNLVAAVLMLLVATTLALTTPDKLTEHISPTAWLASIAAVLVAALLALGWVRRWAVRGRKADQLANATGAEFSALAATQSFEFRSRRDWLGLPLLHVSVAGGADGQRRTARGWIAISDGVAFGGLVACGARLAVAPLSFGFCSVGLLSLGVIGSGAGVVGALGLGICVFGRVAAVGWRAAQGHTFAAAQEFAAGFNAFAPHANDAAAAVFFQQSLFFRVATGIWDLAQATLLFLWLPTLILMSCHLWRAKATR